MLKRALRVLMVEDHEDFSLLLARELQKGGFDVDFERVDTQDGMKKALDGRTWDIVLSDFVMPRFSGLKALEVLKERRSELPCIIVTGKLKEDIAVQAMKAGARDFIPKQNLARLVPAITRELEAAANRQELSEKTELVRRMAGRAEALEKSYWEILSGLRDAFDNGCLKKKTFDHLVLLMEESGRGLHSILQTLNSMEKTGRAEQGR